jgi:hypothetical protein
MKTASGFLNKLFFATFCCAALSVTQLHADHGRHGGGGHHGGNDNGGSQNGGNDNGGNDNGDDSMHGSENLHVELPMTPTAAAPAGSSIELSLEGENESGTTDARVELETKNLAAATYSVSLTLKSDGSTVALGTFTVDAEGEAEIEFGGDATPFPADVDPFNIATVTVSDANGVAIFTADLTNLSTTPASTNINDNVQATAGAAAPSATGSATLIAVASHNKTNGSLQFTAKGLSPSMPVVLAVNGIAAKNLKTDKSGNIAVKIGPKGKTGTVVAGVSLTQVSSATLTDRNGNVLLTATF